MPLSPGRSNSIQNVQHYAITDNPVFKIKIRSLDTGLEQGQGRDDEGSDKDDFTKKFKIGDVIFGQVKGTEEVVTGEIVKISKESSTITVVGKKANKKYKLDPATCKAKKYNGGGKDDTGVEMNFTTENYLMGLLEFEKLNN